jgi:predicted nucleic acid-binding Zn ribbon protein
MPGEWPCPVCGETVAWGEEVCPLCGAALEWEEEDEDDPDAVLMPPWWKDETDITTATRRRTRQYAIAAVVAGALAIALGAVAGGIAWYWLFVGALFLGVGIYALVGLPRRRK